MIGELPKKIKIKNRNLIIRWDTKTALLIFDALNNNSLNNYEKINILLECLYVNSDFNPEDITEAFQKGMLFLNGGNVYRNNKRKILDWKKDEAIIFSAINKVAGKEIRNEIKKIHWWTFLGYFSETHDSLLNIVIQIRNKKNNGKKLEKSEQEFYRNNKELIDLKEIYNKEQQNIISKLNTLCK